LFVIVIITQRHARRPLAMSRFERVDVDVALERVQGEGIAASATEQVDRLGPGELDVGRVVSKCVFDGTTLPGRHQRRAEQDPLRRAALVRGNHVLEAEDVLHRGSKRKNDGEPA
jgi:hypothetical protein